MTNVQLGRALGEWLEHLTLPQIGDSENSELLRITIIEIPRPRSHPPRVQPAPAEVLRPVALSPTARRKRKRQGHRGAVASSVARGGAGQ